MNKKILWAFFSLLFLSSLVLLWQRVEIDNNKKYSFSFDYHSLYMLNKYSGNDVSNLKNYLLSLKKQNVNVITLSNNNLFSLQERGFLSVKSGDDLRNLTNNSNFKGNFTYIATFDNDKEINTIISNRFSSFKKEIIVHDGVEYLGINLNYNKMLYSAIPFLESDVGFIANLGFDIILKIDNKFDNKYSLIIEQFNYFVKKFPSTDFSIEFTEQGYLTFGYINEISVSELPNTFYAYKEFFSDSERQKGIKELSKEKSLYRMHHLSNSVVTNNYKDLDVLEDRIILAVTERNINIVSFQLPLSVDNVHPSVVFEDTLSVLEKSKISLSDFGYTLSDNFDFEGHVQLSDGFFKIVQISSFLSVFVFLLILTKKIIKTSILFDFLVLIFSIIVIVFSDFSIFSLIIKFSILIYAISIPVFAYSILISKLKKIKKESLKSTLFIYLMINSIVVILALLIPSLHFGEIYFDYVLKFSGISIATTIPIFFVIVLIAVFYKKINVSSLISFLQRPIVVYQFIIILLLGFIFIFYISRTGNSGSLLPFEAQFRTIITDLFGVRPRTKEFLIAQPLLFITIYYFKQFDLLRFLLPLTVIAQISIVNTFCHIHTDVSINLYRSILGVSLGALIGFVIILFIKLFLFGWNKFFFSTNKKTT